MPLLGTHTRQYRIVMDTGIIDQNLDRLVFDEDVGKRRIIVES